MQRAGGWIRVAARDESGVTVVELVVAAAILLISAISIIGALTFAGTASAQTGMRDRALNLANQRIEHARNLQYDDVGNPSRSPNGIIPLDEAAGPFSVHTEVSWAPDPAVPGGVKYKIITVTVSWARPNPGTVRLSSAIYGKSYLVNTGVLNVRLRDAETMEPIVGSLLVHVYPSDGSHRWSYSGLYDGNVSFAPLSLGLTSVVVEDNSTYVFDPSETASITVIPDAVTTVVALGYRASSVTVHVVDRTGKKVAGAKVLVTPAMGKPRTAGGDGLVTIGGLFKGDYVIEVYESNAPLRTHYRSTFEITSGGQNLDITVVLADPVLPGTLDAVVTDPNGVPLDDVLVSVFGPAPSLAEVAGSPIPTVYGESAFNKLADGEYRVTTNLAGYASVTTSATVASPSPTRVLITLAPVGPTGALRIVIQTGDGTPVVGRSVRVTYPSGRYVNLVTDATGTAVLGNLREGTYTVHPDRMAKTKHDVLPGAETLATRTATQ